jgi:hypothetical protein
VSAADDTRVILRLYVARGDLDQEEGRKGQHDIGLYSDLDAAIAAVQGEGVFGQPGSVKERVFSTTETSKVSVKNTDIWGGRFVDGKWGYGFLDLRDAHPEDAADRAEYARLKTKFEKDQT